MNLYIYDKETGKHVATISGESNEACQAAANSEFGTNDYGWTYTPAFGVSGGLKEENPEAEEIQAQFKFDGET